MLRECAYLSGMSCPEWERFKQLEIEQEKFMKAAVNFICDGPKNICRCDTSTPERARKCASVQ